MKWYLFAILIICTIFMSFAYASVDFTSFTSSTFNGSYSELTDLACNNTFGVSLDEIVFVGVNQSTFNGYRNDLISDLNNSNFVSFYVSTYSKLGGTGSDYGPGIEFKFSSSNEFNGGTYHGYSIRYYRGNPSMTKNVYNNQSQVITGTLDTNNTNRYLYTTNKWYNAGSNSDPIHIDFTFTPYYWRKVNVSNITDNGFPITANADYLIYDNQRQFLGTLDTSVLSNYDDIFIQFYIKHNNDEYISEVDRIRYDRWSDKVTSNYLNFHLSDGKLYINKNVLISKICYGLRFQLRTGSEYENYYFYYYYLNSNSSATSGEAVISGGVFGSSGDPTLSEYTTQDAINTIMAPSTLSSGDIIGGINDFQQFNKDQYFWTYFLNVFEDVFTNNDPVTLNLGKFFTNNSYSISSEFWRVPDGALRSFLELAWWFLIGYSIVKNFHRLIDKFNVGNFNKASDDLYTSRDLF